MKGLLDERCFDSTRGELGFTTRKYRAVNDLAENWLTDNAVRRLLTLERTDSSGSGMQRGTRKPHSITNWRREENLFPKA